MMREEFQPAIAALQKDLVQLEKKAVEAKKATNVLCKLADVAPMYPVVEDGLSAVLTQIQADTFYGKRMSTAAREYLQMRKGGGQGPAKPRDVYEALKDGGFQFETKDEQTLSIRLTPMTATCRVPPLSRVKLGIGWSRGVARDAEQ